jgi:hypothetical protein
MGIPLAILIGSAVIAGAVLFTFRWEVALGGGQPPVVRLDRWTGAVTACNIDPSARQYAKSGDPILMNCVTQ